MKRIWLILAATLTLSACEKSISEFQTQNFIKYFGGGINAMGFDVAELPNGYIMAGYNTTTDKKMQLLVVRTDRAGNYLWQKECGGTQNEQGKAVVVHGDNFYIVGTTTNDITSITNSFLLVLDSKGDTVHHKTFGDASYSLVLNHLAIDEHFVYLAGESYQNSPTQPNSYIEKYSLTAATEWKWESTPTSRQRFNRIFVKSDGKVIAIGTNSMVPGSAFTHLMVVEVSEFGTPISSTNIPTAANQQYADALLSGTSLTIAYNTPQGDNFEGKLIALDPTNFTTLWHLESGISSMVKALAQSDDGTLSLCGDANKEIYLYQIAPEGTILPSSQALRTMPGNASAIVATSDRGWAIAGTILDYGTMMQLIKTDEKLFLFDK